MPSSRIPSVTRVVRRRWFAVSAGAALAVVVMAASLLGSVPTPAAAQAAPVAQCNDDAASNVGGQGIACTVSVTNHLVVAEGGAITASTPATVTLTRCTGAAGPIGAGAGTCETTTFTSSEPITVVRQCNGSGNGGGGVVMCTTTVSNVFTGLTLATSPATVYQCIGSDITGPGAPGSCTPANTPGVTAATVAQCNGSGNGGTSVGFTCTVGGTSTTVAGFFVNVDQCNGSANGGGALTTCSATVTNEFAAQVAPPAATPAPQPTAIAAPAPAVTPPPAVVAPVPAVAPTPAVAVPMPADTGNAGLRADSGTATAAAMLLLSVAALAFTGAARRMTQARGFQSKR